MKLFKENETPFWPHLNLDLKRWKGLTKCIKRVFICVVISNQQMDS